MTTGRRFKFTLWFTKGDPLPLGEPISYSVTVVTNPAHHGAEEAPLFSPPLSLGALEQLQFSSRVHGPDGKL